MGTIVSYDPYSKQFKFDHNSRWIETLWATIFASNVSSTSKIVFATIISHVYQEPLSFPTQKVLSEAVQKDRRTIIRAIEELREIKLLEVPTGLNTRRNKYVIYDHAHSSLKFSGQGEQLLKKLLDVQVSDFNVIAPLEISDKNPTSDKNVTSPTEKEREEEKEEKKVIQRKEEREEEKEREIAASAATHSSDDSKMTSKEKRLAKLSADSSLKRSSKYGFMEDETKSLTKAMEKPFVKPSIPKDVHKWKTTDFESYFARRYKKLTGKDLMINFAKDRKLIENMIERTSDIEEIKNVIDFVFDNWSDIEKKYNLQKFPNIGFVFSQWFGTLQTTMHAGVPKSRHFIDRRSDYGEYKVPKGLVRRPKNARKTANEDQG